MRGLAIVSGGMDSVTLAYRLRALDADAELTLVSFDYGQRHVRELGSALLAAQALNAEFVPINLTSVGGHLSGSALTDPSVPVPHGHYAAESMRATVVPNRNAIMLAVATGIAVARGAEYVATGVHAGDHAIYPDCRPEFIKSMSLAMRDGNEGFAVDGFQIIAPFVRMTKADIVTLGDTLRVPWAATWSCYEGGAVHCGECGTCVERREAFQLAGVEDPTEYRAESVFR